MYSGRLTSMGQFWMTSSTTSEIGCVKSGLANWTRPKSESFLIYTLKLNRHDEQTARNVKRRKLELNAAYLRVEEDFRPQEALVADVDGELLLGDGVDARVLFDPLGAVCVVLVELLNEVGADVAKTLLTTKHEY